MGRRRKHPVVADEGLIERILATLRQCASDRGRYRFDVSRLVWDTKSMFPELDRPTVAQVHLALERLLARGTIKVRMTLAHGPVISLKTDGEKKNEAETQAQKQ